MPIVSWNRHYWMVSLKTFLVSTGVLSVGLFLTLCVPVVADWASLLSCFTPKPYLYLLTHFIIISILASSKLHAAAAPPNHQPFPQVVSETGTHNHNHDPFLLMKSAPASTPPLSSRIRPRKPLKSTPQGMALGVSKPKRQETLESTWRTITEGRTMALARHLRKSDTWDSHGRRPTVVDPPIKTQRSGGGSPSPSPAASGRRKREASLTQDELNRRVEAFINKFNHEMRLQRQESFKQYQEMMAGGPH